MDEDTSPLPPLASPGTGDIHFLSHDAVDSDICLVKLPLHFCASTTAVSQKLKSLYSP